MDIYTIGCPAIINPQDEEWQEHITKDQSDLVLKSKVTKSISKKKVKKQIRPILKKQQPKQKLMVFIKLEPDLVKIQFRGQQQIQIERQILTKYKNTKLQQFFVDTKSHPMTQNGYILVNRNAKYFNLMLDCLENNLKPILNDFDQQILENEFKFWQIKQDLPKKRDLIGNQDKFIILMQYDIIKNDINSILQEIFMEQPNYANQDIQQIWNDDGHFMFSQFIDNGCLFLVKNQKIIYKIDNGQLYKGQANQHNLPNGIGRELTIQPNLQKLYEGQFRNSLEHGFGREIRSDGIIHIGYFEYGMKHGFGIEIINKNHLRVGKWKNDFM